MGTDLRVLLLWIGLPCCAGALCGLGLRAQDPGASAPTEPEPTARQIRVRPPRPQTPEPPNPRPSPRDCDVLEAEIRALEGLVEDWFGPSKDWPTEVDPRVSPDGFNAWMTAFAEAHEGVEVKEVECASYPCVGVWSSQANLTGALLAELDALGELSVPVRLVPIADASGSTERWIVAASLAERETVDPGQVSVKMNALLNAHGQNGAGVSPNDPEALEPWGDKGQ